MKARRAATDTGTTPGELDAAHPAPRTPLDDHRPASREAKCACVSVWTL